MSLRACALTATLASLIPLALSGCLTKPPLNLPDASVIRFEDGRAVPPDCATLVEPPALVDAGYRRPGVAFGCATYKNLAAMLARPEDLVAPLPYAGADANVATSAVRRLEEDRLKQPVTPTSTTTRTGH
ncbi:CpaD family pilus assembly lipoprotein [Trinickia fusca]|uniref:Uncharacterized protein n=1 Tax=Trinickia fusca TaxID=2419777 RepID=A0A494XNQ9_9BURK|nr:CpaD family pilus assembly lipoprotein [Trinickia fusca]RKP52305.1 hypothetical protein D7S89_01885 [Trinickia fusca]